MKRYLVPLTTAVLFNLNVPVSAADPAWWATRGVKNASPASNLSPASIGQAKHMAAMALAELQTQLSPAEYSALQSEVAAIVNFTTPQTQAEFDNQKMVLLTGQLKALAKPFYDKLRTLDAAWVDNEMVSANIRVVEPGSNPIAYSPYPWSVATSDDQNKAVATLGQLKAVFSLRLDTFRDADHDGLPDAWERLYFPNLDQTQEGDADGDGLSNGRERELGWNPSVSDASVDTDSDGMSDAWELRYFPNLDQTPGGDPDGDGLTNAMEFPLLSNPNNPDTDGDGMGDGYEEYYELSVNSPENIPAPGPAPVPGSGPDNDQDGDGKTNKDEWDGGSIPLSPREQPKFTNPPATLKWFGVAGKVYFVQWTTDFNTWNTLPSEQLGTNHEITFLPTTGFFFRLKIYLDANEDTDADGLPDWREIEKLGTDPDKMDSDGDGLNDDEEVQRGTDPNNPNSDGDDLLDGEDADPKETLIDWKAASETAYLLIDVDAPLNSNPVDLNAKGEVLFHDGIWSSGQWTALPEAEDQGGPHPDYLPSSSRWTHLGDDGSISGESQYTINDGGPDLQGVPMVMFAASRASALITSASTLPAWESDHPEGTRCLEPLGVASNGRIFAQRTRLEANPRQRSLVVLDHGLQMTSTLVFDSGHDIKQADVARNGSVIALLDTDSGTGTALELAAWNSSGAKLTVPAAQGYHCDLHATELAEGGTVMTAWSDSGWSKVYVPSQTSTMSRIDSLSASNIVLFAGDGTAMTDDHHLWRNGKLIPLRDLCQRFGELLDEGWYLQPLKSNKHGAYLIQAQGPNGEMEVKLAVPIRIEGVDTTVNPANLLAPDRGVDNISIRANNTPDNGNQSDMWIMAPIAGTNTVRFLSQANPSLQLHLSAENATFTPAVLNSPDQQITVTGTGAATSDSSLVVKVGAKETGCSIKLKAMKKRTVKVAIHAVGLNVVPPEIPVVPALGEIQNYLNSVFAPQLNVNFTVTPGPAGVPLSWDIGRASIFELSGPGSEKLHEGNGTFDFTKADKLEQEDKYIDLALGDKDVDINVYILTRHLLGWYDKNPGAGSLSGVAGMTRRTPRVILIDGKQNEFITTIAHEIGHCMIGFGHPNPDPLAIALAKLAGKPPPPRGPAPHDGVRAEELKKRLMYSTTLPAPGKTMVKSEWDAAETWLNGLPYGRQLLNSP